MVQMPTAEEFAALQKALSDALGELRVVTTERDLALERLRALQGQLFAAKSEARGTDQKDLFLNEAEALAPTDQTPPAETEEEESTPVAGHQRKKRGRRPLDPALPRDIVRHELPESERVCAHDGHALVEIGAEVSEQMHVIPEQVRVLQHHRIKYACPCCDLSLKVAPTPARIIPRGLLTEEAQAWVITGKYQFGMPLYRTAALLRRFGGDIVSNTLARRCGANRPGRAARHQPAAGSPARQRPHLRGRDHGSGAQGAWAQGTDEKLHVGPDERNGAAGAPVRVRTRARRSARQEAEHKGRGQ